MGIKSFEEFNSEFQKQLAKKAEEELKFRAEFKAGKQEIIVNNILRSLESRMETAINNTCLDPISTFESCYTFKSVTKDDCEQIILCSLNQIESELLQLGYDFEAEISELSKGYQLTITLLLEKAEKELIPEVDVLGLMLILKHFLDQ